MDPRRMMRQEALLWLALRERGVPHARIRTDHANGRSWVDGREYGIVYPDSFIERASQLFGGPKERRHFFRGYMGEGRRTMLAPYADDVEESGFGRDRAKKDAWDEGYFRALASAEFGLCPHHPEWPGPRETLWTYRFVDCVLVGAIPVLFRATPLGAAFTEGFHVAWDDDPPHKFDPEHAHHNHALGRERFSL